MRAFSLAGTPAHRHSTSTARSFRTILRGAIVLSFFITGTVFAADHAIEIRSMRFSESTLQVAVGDTVTFINRDSAPHTATATDGSFDTGRMTGGQSATITISKAGTLEYFCAVHPSMKARITAK